MNAKAAGPTPPCALVTGASSGIGEAFARALAARGWRLVLVARREGRLGDVAASLGGPDRAEVIAADLAAPGAVGGLVAELDRRGRIVDLLVNDAGLGHTGPFHEAPWERLEAILAVNTRALVELTRRVLPGMVERGRGGIINVVSMSAFQPVPYLAVYAASKAFVLSFTEALATELEGTGVRVQALCPGNVPTGFQAVAGTDRVAFDSTPRTSPEAVAEASLRAFERGRLRVFSALRDRLVAAVIPWAPGSLVRHVAAGLFRPR